MALINYIYDPVGNIVEMNDLAQQTHYFSNSVIEPKGQYEYDALYRLTKATGRELTSLQLPTHEDFANNIPVPNTAANAMQNYEQQFTYDELGNILQMKSVGNWTRDYFYNTNDNKLLGHTNGVTEYTCDAHGNITAMPHLTQMNWDYKNQLLGATNGTFISYYVYDASGNQVRKVVVKGNITEERYYLGSYEVYRKTNNGTLEIERSTVFLSDDKKKIAQIDNDSTTETIRYQYDNHLGSASLELDQNAAIISYEEYHPFGTTSYRSGRTETEVTLKRYKYVGKERDEETGLYNYGFRFYAPWLCRFVSVDPLQHKYPHYTPFQYAGNKPITFIDLDGLEEAKVEDKDGYKAFASTNYGKKYIEAFKTGPLKNHRLVFAARTDNKIYDSSSFTFNVNGMELSYDKISISNINEITSFNSYVKISKTNMNDSPGKMAETIGHEVFLHNVHKAFALNDLFNSKLSPLQKFEKFNEISNSADFLYNDKYTQGGQKDHAEYIMGNVLAP